VAPWAKALFDKNTRDNLMDNPKSRCLPRGVPKADAFDLHKISPTPELIVILYEYQTIGKFSSTAVSCPKIPTRLGRDTRLDTGRGTRR
jgi:hypothetical protein